jgi:hypothetical protein
LDRMSRRPLHVNVEREGVAALVVGAGRFGSRALRSLQRLHPDWRLTVVDRAPQVLAPWRDCGVMIREGDAVEVLDRLLQAEAPEWIVPAVPFHLAFVWLCRRLSYSHPVERAPIPPDLPVPNPLAGPQGDLYTSFAGFICPEDCPEPRGTCTVTGERRTLPLFELLRDLAIPDYRTLGLRSHQLGPGVGGYRSRELRCLLAAANGFEGDLAVYTACRCHGVLSGMRIGPRQSISVLGR